MKSILDAFWRAWFYCLHPRVIALSFIPIALLNGLVFSLGFFYWDWAISQVTSLLHQWSYVDHFVGWLEQAMQGRLTLRNGLAGVMILLLTTPLLILLTLTVVAGLMAPSAISLVAERRFPKLERNPGMSWWAATMKIGMWLLLGFTLLIVTLPLWLIPPLFLLIPTLLWGWVSAKVFGELIWLFHASKTERTQLHQAHNKTLWIMGTITGFVAAIPAFSSVIFVAQFPPIIALFIWINTLILAFAALWFAHFGLRALHELRLANSQIVPHVLPDVDPALDSFPQEPTPWSKVDRAATIVQSPYEQPKQGDE